MRIRNQLLKLSVLICTLSISPFAMAGGHAGNGGGVSEKYILYAYYHLSSYIRVCLDSSVCQVTTSERETLAAIEASLPREYATKNQIQFHSGKEWQAFFTIDGLVRVAKTGDNVGDPIYVYSDELYSPAGKPITLGFAIATLVHEFTHHHGLKDNASDTPDVLAEKVELGYERDSIVSQTQIINDTITATYFKGPSDAPYNAQLLISNSASDVDVSYNLVTEAESGCGRRYAYLNTGYIIPNYSVGNISNSYTTPESSYRNYDDPFYVVGLAWGDLDPSFLGEALTVSAQFDYSEPFRVLVTFLVYENPSNRELSVVGTKCSAR